MPDAEARTRPWPAWRGAANVAVAWAVRLEWLALALVAGALAWRYLDLVHLGLAGGMTVTAPYSYDEATYVDLAHHPWHSSYYPDRLFLRHPPLSFVVLGLYARVFTDAEPATRFLALVQSAAACWFLVRAVHHRAGPRIATVAALLLAVATPLHAYLIQATMYPLAFLLLCLGLWAGAVARPRLERAALVLLCLTHLFGFAYLAAWLWSRHRASPGQWSGLKAGLRSTWPAVAWLAIATLLGVLLHAPGQNLLGLGPLGQAARSAGVVKQSLAGGLALHVAAVAMTLLLCGAPLFWPAWRDRREGLGAWVLGALALTAYLAVAPPFLRYALLLAPVLLAVGLPALLRSSFALPAAAAVLLAVAVMPLSQAYWVAGPDPSAANDVPGYYDADAGALAAAWTVGHGVIGTHLPTQVAHYLLKAHAKDARPWQVLDASTGPEVLVVGAPHAAGQPDAGVTIVRMGGPTADGILAVRADAYVVPTYWGAQGDLEARGLGACTQVTGLVVMAPGCKAQA